VNVRGIFGRATRPGRIGRAYGREMATVVRAAGGVVYRAGPGGEIQVAVIHRPVYDDWSLPKGKIRRGEDEEAAALREVMEETGLRCSVERPLVSTEYVDRRGRSKVVSYWMMRPIDGTFRPTGEVDELRWLPLSDAMSLLTYQRDRTLLGLVEGRSRNGT